MVLALLAFAAGLAGPIGGPAGPKRAPPVYATHNYALTFLSPAGSSYCPLSERWSGSDHGTILFLRPPRRCGGSGFPSSSRGFEPADTPRIEVYYGYQNDDSSWVRECHGLRRIRFVDQRRSLCRSAKDHMIVLEVRASYQADELAEVSLRLVTTADRVARDMAALDQLASSLRPCRVSDATPALGSGAECPKVGWF